MCFKFVYTFYMFSLLTCSQAVKFIKTYNDTSICGQTILLGTELFSGLVDVWFGEDSMVNSSSFTCNLTVETLPRSYIGIKFLSNFNIDKYSMIGCAHSLKINSNDIDIVKCNTIPQIELRSREFVHIAYELTEFNATSIKNVHFKVLFFTYSLSDGTNKCPVNETPCSGSSRCLFSHSICSSVYDFCNNGYKSCSNNTDIDIFRKHATFTGLYIFIICSIITISLTLCTCARKGLHLCDCTCNCCSSVDTTGNDAQTGSRQTVSTTVRHVFAFSSQDSVNRDGDVNFDLPPSYSYLEHSGSQTGTNVETVETNVEQTLGTNQNSSSELPPSYSTVIGHEDEYNVHIY